MVTMKQRPVDEMERKIFIQEVIDRVIEHGYMYVSTIESVNEEFQLSNKRKNIYENEQK